MNVHVRLTVWAGLCLLFAGSTLAWAGITQTGAVSDTGTHYYVADSGDGSVLIDDDSDLVRNYGYVGYTAGHVGTATITGIGSSLQAHYQIRVGQSGDGTLNVLNGGLADGDVDYLGYNAGATGTGNVDGPGSRWEHAYLYVGYSGHGELNITGGGEVTSHIIRVGLNVGATGTVTVSDSNSFWDIGDYIQLGRNGSGTMTVANGATVVNGGAGAFVGYNTGSSGTATVCGAGSNWTSANAPFYVGYYGTGSLTLCGGGTVGGDSLSVNAASTVDVQVIGDSMIVVGGDYFAGSVANNGTIRFHAGPNLAPGSYTPVTERDGRAIAWSGGGAYEAFGGVWDDANKAFHAGAVTHLLAGQADAVSPYERMLFTDANSGASVGASFDGGPGNGTFSADLLAPADVAALADLPGVDGTVLAAWDFTTDLSGADVLLSFDVGAGATDLAVWHFDGSNWSPYSPGDLAYDGAGTVSFTVNGFSGYAVTGVPEPGALALLGLGLAIGPFRRRRKA